MRSKLRKLCLQTTCECANVRVRCECASLGKCLRRTFQSSGNRLRCPYTLLALARAFCDDLWSLQQAQLVGQGPLRVSSKSWRQHWHASRFHPTMMCVSTTHCITQLPWNRSSLLLVAPSCWPSHLQFGHVIRVLTILFTNANLTPCLMAAVYHAG
jgi:hypothetical protein